MPFPKLSPLQSRLAASLVASLVVFVLYLALSSPHFAYALDVDSIAPADHNHERLLSQEIIDEDYEVLELLDYEYEAEFIGLDRGIVGRAGAILVELPNNEPKLMNVELGTSVSYVFTNVSLWAGVTAPTTGLPPSELRKRSDEDTSSDDEKEGELIDDIPSTEHELRSRQAAAKNVTLYITFNTCLQPDPKNGNGSAAPQLELYVSQTIQNPGPGEDATKQQKVIADGGFANATIQATSNVYIGVAATNATGYAGIYSVEIAASIDAPYHSYNNTDPNLFFIDSDTSSALLATKNLTFSTNGTIFDEWMSIAPPYVVFATNQDTAGISGVKNSYCGLEKYAQIAGTRGGLRTNMVQTSMTDTTLGPYPKQQFYFQGLNGSSQYYGILGMTGNSTAAGSGVVGGGGRVWQTMNFTTQSDGNCAVIFNLTFCNSVAYAVPGNPNTFNNVTALADFYDNAAATAYSYFDKAMQQIPCDIGSTGKYSLARNCTDCADAYKYWLCSVMIPRCMDYSATESWLQERNVVQQYPNTTMLPDSITGPAENVMYLNSSRNPNIDTVVQPGPYKEILPCQDLCYNLVQSCPSSFAFGCPQPGDMGFNYSYGLRPDGSNEQAGQITCNYPGAAYNLSRGTMGVAPITLIVIASLFISFILL